MLKLIENGEGKLQAQSKLQASLKKAWVNKANRLVIWKQNRRELEVFHNYRVWFSPIVDQEQDSKIYNSFGKYTQSGGLQTSVLVNIPINSNQALLSGFYAIDCISKKVYLMHDGGIGGGVKGVGKDAFLEWTSSETVPVECSDGTIREGLIVTPIDSKNVGYLVERFIEVVAEFKLGVSKSATSKELHFGLDLSGLSYSSEYSGKKTGLRSKHLDYVSRHGEVVEALKNWINKKKSDGKKKIFNTRFIDLGVVSEKGELVELYEVKTSLDRQSLYTAIGQLCVHGYKANSNLKKYIVLPVNGDTNSVNILKKVLDKLDIKIIQFKLTLNKVIILG